MDVAKLRPIDRKMYDLLKDGELHLDRELFAFLNDDLSPMSNIAAHLTTLRKHLKPDGVTIKHVKVQGRSYYRMVRIFSAGSWDE